MVRSSMLTRLHEARAPAPPAPGAFGAFGAFGATCCQNSGESAPVPPCSNARTLWSSGSVHFLLHHNHFHTMQISLKLGIFLRVGVAILWINCLHSNFSQSEIRYGALFRRAKFNHRCPHSSSSYGQGQARIWGKHIVLVFF